MNTLFLQLSRFEPHLVARAWAQTTQGVQSLEAVSLDEFGKNYAGHPVVVFMPSTRCLLTKVSASVRQIKQLGSTLNWLIEEQTGDDAEALQVVAITGDDNEKVYAAATSHKLIEDTVKQLHEAGLRPVAVLPDFVLLPTLNTTWQLADWAEDQLTLRTDFFSGIIIEKQMLEPIVAAAWQEHDKSGTLSIAVSPSLRVPLEQYLSLKNINAELVDLSDVSETLAAKIDWTRHAANFLQGKLATSNGFALPKIWQVAALFVICAFGVQLLLDGMQYGYYRHKARQSQTEAVAAYKKLFPADRRIVNLERQLKTQLEGGGKNNQALSTLTKVAESLKGTGLSTQRIDYSSNALMLDVTAQAVGELDRFQTALSQQGFQAEVVSANTQGQIVRGRIKIEG
jgi:general secretion pathway protein L